MGTFDTEEEPGHGTGEGIDSSFRGEHWNKTPSAERQSFLRLTRELASLPLEQSAAALETGAAIAGISLRAGIEFLRADRRRTDREVRAIGAGGAWSGLNFGSSRAPFMGRVGPAAGNG